MVFCNICFLFWMMILGVFKFNKCFKWLFWLIIWWYKLFKLFVVNCLLFNWIIGWIFGGMIGSIFKIIYEGLLFELWNDLIIFKCLIVWVSFWLVVDFNLLCNNLSFLLRSIFLSKFLIFFVFIFVMNWFGYLL